MTTIKLENIYKIYDNNVTAVSNFNLEIKDREFIVFVGPSGCGKSTTLRMIAGLEEISKGRFLVDDKLMNDTPPKDRDIAMVFQNYALYPHMTVYDNMAFGLKLRKFSKKEIKQRVEGVAKILGLEEYLYRKPKALSGGQRQRVALGRAVVRDAKIFLMDEPLSNLDAKLRVQMRSEIVKLHNRLKTITIYVTHDQTEAMTMASRLVVMKDGVINQIGSPKDVYDKPENVFVAGFIGSPAMNFMKGTLKGNFFEIYGQAIEIPEGQLKILENSGYQNKELIMGVRPEHLNYESVVEDVFPNSTIDVTVEIAELLGSETMLYCKFFDQSIVARASSHTVFKAEQKIKLVIEMNFVHFFDITTEKRI